MMSDEIKQEELEQESEQQEEVSQPSLEEQIEKLEAELAQAKNDVARAYADTDNLRKRLQREADTAKKYRFQQAGLALLPILDNLKMATKVQSDNQELMNYVKGFEMIVSQLEQVLTSEGVQEIEAEGKAFDHNTMQALTQEKVDGVQSGQVIEVLQKGYMLKDRILRPALVKVSE